MVYASSSSVYGMNEKVPFCETDMTDTPVSLYAVSYTHLVRFPLFYALEPDEVKYICEQIKSFYTSERDEASFGER